MSNVRDQGELSDVRVIVLSYGKQADAEQLIGQLLTDRRLSVDSILEVHNPAGTDEVVSNKFGHHLKVMPDNVGYAGGMNAGLSDSLTTKYEFVCLLTHDVRLEVRDLLEMRRALGSDPQLGVVGPVLQHNGTVWSAGRVRKASWRFPHLEQPSLSGCVVRTDSLDGSVLMIRRSSLDGLEFDEKLFMYYEETDLLEHLNHRGIGVAVVTSARAESEMGTSRRPRAHAYLMARNGLEVAMRHGGRPACVRHLVWLAEESARKLWGSVRRRDLRAVWLELARIHAKTLGVLGFIRQDFGKPPSSVSDGDLIA